MVMPPTINKAVESALLTAMCAMPEEHTRAVQNSLSTASGNAAGEELAEDSLSIWSEDDFGSWDLFAQLGIEPTADNDGMSDASRSRDTLATASTETSTVTVVARGVLELTLSELCNLISERHSLQKAEIVSMQVYTEPAKVWGHRFMILELRRPQRRILYLRLDRHRSRRAVALGFLRPRKEVAHDTACLSPSKELLVRRGDIMNYQHNFDHFPTLGELQYLLLAVCGEMANMDVRQAGSWFFVSLIQHFLKDPEDGSKPPKFADGIRSRIEKRLQLHYNIPTPFSLTELLLSFVRCQEDYPNLSQADVAEVLRLSTELDALGEYGSPRAQALSYKIATSIQLIARQLDPEYYRAEILWKESARLLEILFKRDPKRHQPDYGRALHHHASQLYRARDYTRAIHVSQEAVRLQRQLYKADPASSRNCADLASSLDLYSKCLKKLGRTEEARSFTKEALALLHRLYESDPDGRRVELSVFLRNYGSFLFRDNFESHHSSSSSSASTHELDM